MARRGNPRHPLYLPDESCVPCFAIRERIEKWLESHPGADGRYIAIRENMEASAQMGILSVPTVAAYVSVEDNETITIDFTTLSEEEMRDLIDCSLTSMKLEIDDNGSGVLLS